MGKKSGGLGRWHNHAPAGGMATRPWWHIDAPGGITTRFGGITTRPPLL